MRTKDPNTKDGDNGNAQPQQEQPSESTIAPQIITPDINVDWSQKGLDIDPDDPNRLST